MSIEQLRTGWPEAILTGQYHVVRSRAYDIDEMLKSELLLGIPDAAEPVLEVRIGGGTAYTFCRRYLVPAAAAHPVVLELRARSAPAWRWPWWLFPLRVLRLLFGDTVHEVIDNRLGVVVGAVVRRWGLGTVLLPQRMVVLNPAGQPIGRLVEFLTLSGRLPWGGRRFSVVGAGGVRAARVRQAARVLGYSARVDVEPAASLDPRLIMACVLLLES